MKKITLILLLAGCSLVSYGQKKYPSPKQSKIDKEVWNVTNNQNTELSFISHAEELQRVEKDAKLAMLAPEELEKQKAALSKGGYLALTVYRATVSTGNMENFTVIIQDEGGKDLLRQDFKASVPKVGSNSLGSYFYNTGVMLLDEPLPALTNVYIIDKLGQKRYEYQVKQL